MYAVIIVCTFFLFQQKGSSQVCCSNREVTGGECMYRTCILKIKNYRSGVVIIACTTLLHTVLWSFDCWVCVGLANNFVFVSLLLTQNKDWDILFGEGPAKTPPVATPTSTLVSTIASRPHTGSKSSDHSPERQRSPKKKEPPLEQTQNNPLYSGSDTALLRPAHRG